MASLGTPLYYITIGHLSYISSELHTTYAHLFNPSLPEDTKELMRKKLQCKLNYLNSEIFIDGRKYITGNVFCVADAYLFIVLSWSAHAEVDLDECKLLKCYYDRVSSLSAVAEAFELMDHNPSKSLRGI